MSKDPFRFDSHVIRIPPARITCDAPIKISKETLFLIYKSLSRQDFVLMLILKKKGVPLLFVEFMGPKLVELLESYDKLGDLVSEESNFRLRLSQELSGIRVELLFLDRETKTVVSKKTVDEKRLVPFCGQSKN